MTARGSVYETSYNARGLRDNSPAHNTWCQGQGVRRPCDVFPVRRLHLRVRRRTPAGRRAPDKLKIDNNVLEDNWAGVIALGERRPVLQQRGQHLGRYCTIAGVDRHVRGPAIDQGTAT